MTDFYGMSLMQIEMKSSYIVIVSAGKVHLIQMYPTEVISPISFFFPFILQIF